MGKALPMRPPPDTRYPYQGPEELRGPVQAALQRVVDPEMALAITDLGLVREVRASPMLTHVVLTMTSAACPVTDLILDEVEAELARALPLDMHVCTELVWSPPWQPADMSPRAKAFMGWGDDGLPPDGGSGLPWLA